MEKPRIYVSYAWKDASALSENREQVVDEIQTALENAGFHLIRDKTGGVGYGDSINEFMDEIGQGDFIVVVLSEKSLKSVFCMYEVTEIMRDRHFAKRVLPIVLQDANIFERDARDTYVDYWDDMVSNQMNYLERRGTKALEVDRKLAERYKLIRLKLGEFIEVMMDLNAQSPEILRDDNYQAVIDRICSLSGIKLTVSSASAEKQTTKAESALQECKQELGTLKQRLQTFQLFNAPAKPNDDIDWDNLLAAIDSGDCVIFLGPDIGGRKASGNRYDELFEDIGKKADVRYILEEGFFEPMPFESSKMLANRAARVFQQPIEELNPEAARVLLRLAHLPIGLFVSALPDSGFHQLLDFLGQQHGYSFYDGESSVVLQSELTPMIYGILGNVEQKKLLLTHESFYLCLRTLRLTIHIETSIKEATHFLFLGVDFNKWSHRLLLFLLELSKRETAGFRHVVNVEVPHEDALHVLKKQFGISSVEDNVFSFLNELLYRVSNGNELQLKDSIQIKYSLLESELVELEASLHIGVYDNLSHGIEDRLDRICKDIRRLTNLLKI